MKSYVKPTLFYFPHLFFYLCVELLINDLAADVIGAEHVVTLYGGISFAVAVGFLLFPLLRRIIKGILGRRLSLIGAWALCIASLVALATLTAPAPFVAAALCVTTTAGYIGGFVFYTLALSAVEQRYMGRFVGVTSAALFIVQYGFNQVSAWMGRYSLAFTVCVLGLCLSATVYLLLFRSFGPLPFESPSAAPEPQKDMKKYLWGTFFIIVVVCGLMGITDGIVTALHAGQTLNVSGIPRLLNAPAMLVIGWLYDHREGRFFPVASILCMIIQILAVFLFSSAEGFNVALAFLYICGPVGSIYSIAALTSIASSTSAPELWAVMGRVAKYVPNGIMAMIGGYLFTSSAIIAFAIAYVVLLVMLILLFFGQGRLSIQRAEAHEPPPPPDLSQYNLTARETEVIGLLAAGLSTAQIAQNLFISEKTVRAHISNMIAKVGVNSRVELILLVRR